MPQLELKHAIEPVDFNVLRHRDKDYPFFHFMYFVSKKHNPTGTFLKGNEFIQGFKEGNPEVDRKVIELIGEFLVLAKIDPQFYVFAPIPAKDPVESDKRYKNFVEQLSARTGLLNGYEHMTLGVKRPMYVHRDEERTRIDQLKNYDLDPEFFAGKKVIIFDDTTSYGRSLFAMIEQIEEANGHVEAIVTLGKSVLPEDHVELMVQPMCKFDFKLAKEFAPKHL